MHSSASYHPYHSTGAFSSWVLDYLRDIHELRPFYAHRPDEQGILDAIAIRRNYPINRELLASTLELQYRDIPDAEAVNKNISLLHKDNTFTICTAHQPHLFLGPMYLLYKIIHVIKLADTLNKRYPEYHFLPVYFMGSEDADLAELGEIFIQNNAYRWGTNQKGAVGRMLVDEALLQMLHEMALPLGSEPYGHEIIHLLKKCFQPGESIEIATFKLIHGLLGKYGLLVFLPDNPAYKSVFTPVVQKELLQQFSHSAVQDTIKIMPEKYQVKPNGRDLNLFYLDDQIRERIIKIKDGYHVNNSGISFTEEEMMLDLQQHPERYSPNVVLRPIYQEMLLPNVAFVGGGSELAYWMQLKNVFEKASVPYPPLFLRNSFLLLDDKMQKAMEELHVQALSFFQPEDSIINEWLMKHSDKNLSLDKEIQELDGVYEHILVKAKESDATLEKHLLALKEKAKEKLKQLQQKMIRAEKENRKQ